MLSSSTSVRATNRCSLPRRSAPELYLVASLVQFTSPVRAKLWGSPARPAGGLLCSAFTWCWAGAALVCPGAALVCSGLLWCCPGACCSALPWCTSTRIDLMRCDAMPFGLEATVKCTMNAAADVHHSSSFQGLVHPPADHVTVGSHEAAVYIPTFPHFHLLPLIFTATDMLRPT
ncbi:hypothetical protein HDV63DRAFT_144496 [Trichoderma sp. SZMC 28014]